MGEGHLHHDKLNISRSLIYYHICNMLLITLYIKIIFKKKKKTFVVVLLENTHTLTHKETKVEQMMVVEQGQCFVTEQ